MGAVSGCCPELRREMHGRESGHPGKIGESDALFEMRADIVLDSLYPPLGQRIHGMSRQLEPRDVHDQGLRNALYVDAVPNGTAFDQCLAEQFGKRITDNEIVQFPYRIGLARSRCRLALMQITG